MINPFMLFGGQVYYPGGGFDDYIASFNSIDEAKNEAIRRLKLSAMMGDEDAVKWAEIADFSHPDILIVYRYSNEGNWDVAKQILLTSEESHT